MKLLTSSTKSKPSLRNIGATIAKFTVPLFILFVVAVFGYLYLQISQATNAKADASSDTAVTKSMPKIDEAVANRLLELEDNSVNVQTLFNDARENPFE